MPDNAYGRSGLAVGGKGGMSKSGAYEFGAKSAGEYLSGGLAGEYAQASSVLRSDIAGGANTANIGQLSAKMGARKNIGKLRDIAQSQAVGEFLDFAGTKGRGSQATASQGLVTGETYAPESTAGFESAAGQNYFGSSAGGVPSKYGKAMAGTMGTGAYGMNQAIMGQAAPMEFGGTGPVSYAEAAMGKTGALQRKLKTEGQAVEMAKSLGATSGMFAGAAESQIAPVKPRGRVSTTSASYGKATADRNKQVEAARQSILAMTPAERYLQGTGSV
jgi:hypothetical protein